MRKLFKTAQLLSFILLLTVSCKIKNKPADTNTLNLKRGELVLCGPPEKQFGTVAFDVSCSENVGKDFNLAVALLHSFEYDEAEKVFARIISVDPGCAMAYWGVAMCNYHPLWAPPTQAELEKGAKVIAIARSIKGKTERESGYIDAIGMYYTDWNKVDDRTRRVNVEKAMERMYRKYPRDKEAAIFYALALDAAADPADQSFAKQRKAGSILNTLYPNEPGHPGIVHYIIHTYDYPGLAELALPAARKYASIAPASAHAQHMPSHIFTRLGLWDECIKSNLVSTSSAKCYAENADMKGHWDEELHGMDYLVYAYLQKGDNSRAKEQRDYLGKIEDVYPLNFKVAYAFAAIPARYVLENKIWNEAANLETHPVAFPWEKFPWQKAIIHFTRALGAIHTGNRDLARSEQEKLKVIYDTLTIEKDNYKAHQVEIQLKAVEAWMLLKEGKTNKALECMNDAAAMEDATEKSPVTPGEVIPARELLGDLCLQMGNYTAALEAYQEDLQKHPNRFNGLYGAGLAAEKSGDREKAKVYYRQLLDSSIPNSPRPELALAKAFLKKN
ncbi:MAG TPA: tetratricopeptide repeat protein [Puia sp.]|nr:tetratricopeptide repeat protein [Puia sp.]